MKTLVNLTAVATDSTWADSRRSMVAVHHEITPGVFVHVGLGAAGLQVYHGEKAVGMPLEEIIKLARKYEPGIGVEAPALQSPAKPII